MGRLLQAVHDFAALAEAEEKDLWIGGEPPDFKKAQTRRRL